MHELETISNKELTALKTQINAREAALQTKEGRKEAAAVMIAMFDYFATSGYKLPDVDYTKMAAVYADQLSEHIALYGYDAIKKAAREFIRQDESAYHALPTSGQLIKILKEQNGNPRALIARKEYERRIEEDDKRVREELASRRR